VTIYRLVDEYSDAYGAAHAASTTARTATVTPLFSGARTRSVTRIARTLAYHWIWLGPLMIVTVGLFDLVCTISAFEKGWLVEMNPIANAALAHAGAAGLAVYRFVMTAIGCILLTWGMRTYRLRRFVGSVRRVRIVVWTGQAVLVASHVALLGWWVAWLSV
jgi:hypothetical protein